MDIMIGVTVSNDLKPAARARIEELLVHGLVRDNAYVMSAVILREQGTHPVTRQIKADEDTRQSR